MSDATINIGICLDERMLNAAFVLLASIKANVRAARPVKVHALTNFASPHLSAAAVAMTDERFELVPRQVENLPGAVPIRDQITNANYLRFLFPTLLPEIKKLIYIDSDTVVHRDLAPLFDVSLGDCALAAVPDYAMLIGSLTWQKFHIPFEGRLLPFSSYAEDVLELPCPNKSEYFNSGVMLLDLDVWRDEKIVDRALACLATRQGLYFPDQDALNMIVHGHYVALDARWNALANCAFSAHVNLFAYLNRSGREWERLRRFWRRDPWIVHYAGANKPWIPNDPETPKDDLWWRYAMMSPMKDLILDDYRALEGETQMRQSKVRRVLDNADALGH